jgi:hypothetical protein
MQIMTNYELTQAFNRLARKVCCIASEGTEPDANIVNIDDDAPDLAQTDTIQILNDGSVYLVDSDGTSTILSVQPEEIDVFLVAGQSNASGKGVAASSPNPQFDTVYHWYPGAFNMVTDEVGNANTGSAWPSFGITWHSLTGRKICFVPSAVESSAQVAAADSGAGNWDTTGTLYDTAVSNLENALLDIAAAGYTPVLRGILWSQGETDAAAINATTITSGQYTTALTTMVTNFRVNFGVDLPFYIFRTGTRTDQSDAGYLAIRDAQDAFAYSDPLRNRMVFRNAVDFPTRSLMIDVVHYSQAGYNEMGRIGAETIVSGNDWGIQKTTIASGNISYYLPTQYAKLSIGSLQSLPTELLTVKSVNSFDSGIITSSGTTNQALANLKVENLSAGSSAASGIRFYNDTGIKAQVLLYSTGSSNPGASVLLIHQAGSSVPIRNAMNTGDFEIATGGTALTNVKWKIFNNGQGFASTAGGTPTRTNTTAAIMEWQSTTQGVLLPRMTQAQRNAITAPVAGLAIYQTDATPGLRVYNGTNWMRYTETAD